MFRLITLSFLICVALGCSDDTDTDLRADAANGPGSDGGETPNETDAGNDMLNLEPSPGECASIADPDECVRAGCIAQTDDSLQQVDPATCELEPVFVCTTDDIEGPAVCMMQWIADKGSESGQTVVWVGYRHLFDGWTECTGDGAPSEPEACKCIDDLECQLL